MYSQLSFTILKLMCALLVMFVLSQSQKTLIHRTNRTRKCPFYSKYQLDTILQDMFAKDKDLCHDLKKCPKIPDWIKNEDITEDASINVKKEFLSVPQDENRSPVVVKVTMVIEYINSLSDKNMDFSIEYYLRLNWVIGRDEICTKLNETLRKVNITLGSAPVEIKNGKQTLWFPDIFIMNAKTEATPCKTLATEFFDLTLNPVNITGNKTEDICEVKYYGRFSAVIACNLIFQYYPVDIQDCKIQLRSFFYDANDVQLRWDGKGIFIDDETKLTEFKLEIRNTTHTIEEWAKTNYSVISVDLFFERQFANKFMGIYVPCLMILFLSYSTLWLGINSIAERVSVLISLLLSLIAQFSSCRQLLPPVQYITGIDKWMIISVSLIIGLMVQCAVIHFTYYSDKQAANREQDELSKRCYQAPRRRNHSVDRYRKNAILHFLFDVPCDKGAVEYNSMKIDAYSRVLFGILFFLFSAFYWPFTILRIDY